MTWQREGGFLSWGGNRTEKWAFDFLKVKKDGKKPAKGKPQIPSKGTATFSGKSFPVIEWSAKGFIIAN